MKIICIVPCGNKKIWDVFPDAGPTPAKNAYVGGFASKCQEYARAFYPDNYFILSAKYGFLQPEEIVPNKYNVTFKKPSTNPITIVELIDIAQQKGLFNADQIIVMVGKDYTQIVKSVFPAKEIVEPLLGCKGNGYMMHKIKMALLNMSPIVS
jgi:hypothetical protein